MAATVPFNGLADSGTKLIKEVAASSSATVSFIHGTSDVVFDGTFDIYEFHFINIHPATDSVHFLFQGDTGTNTNYNQTITSTHFTVGHNEAGNDTLFTYQTGMDQAQGTSFQKISNNVGNGNDECVSGTLHLFDPSNTTFVKHFISRIQVYRSTGSSAEASSVEAFTAGYFNTTSAIDEIQFKMYGVL